MLAAMDRMKKAIQQVKGGEPVSPLSTGEPSGVLAIVWVSPDKTDMDVLEQVLERPMKIKDESIWHD